MADAYCGPSNALQSFQKHASVDRTLQQDRLSARRSPLENFRSPEPNAGILDPEFEAFQASQPGPLPFEAGPAHHFQQSHVQRGKQPAFAPAIGAPDWAADFQRLNVSPPPVQYHQPQNHAQAVQQRQAEERASFGSPVNSTASWSQQSYGAQYGMYQPRFGGQGMFGGYNSGMRQQSQPQMLAPEVQQHDQMDAFGEAAFERAFDAARDQIIAEEVIEPVVQDEGTSGPIEPFPYLSVLRFSMAACLLDPTETNMHRAALFMRLLEEHSTRFPNDPQIMLFRPILKHLAQWPSPDQYHFRDQAERIMNDIDYNADADEPPGLAAQASALGSLYTILLPDTSSIGTTAAGHVEHYREMTPSEKQRSDELMQDIEMQIDVLKSSDLADRAFEILGDGIANSVLEALANPTARRALQAELALVNPSKELAEMPTDFALTHPNNAYDLLYQHGVAAARAPESMEMRESLAAQSSARAPQPLRAFEGQLGREQAMREFEELGRVDGEQQDQERLQKERDDNDDLARTAGELLTKVSDNTSAKFQNSTFLELMRRLRDREVRVEGDKMIESSQSGEGALDGGAKPDYIPPAPINQVTAAPPYANGISLTSPAGINASADVQDQTLRDGEDVVKLLHEQAREDRHKGLENFYHPSFGNDFGAYMEDRVERERGNEGQGD